MSNLLGLAPSFPTWEECTKSGMVQIAPLCTWAECLRCCHSFSVKDVLLAVWRGVLGVRRGEIGRRRRLAAKYGSTAMDVDGRSVVWPGAC